MAASRRPALPDEQWQRVRAELCRRMTARMSGFSREDVDDEVQNVLHDLLDYVDRVGVRQSLEGLIAVIADRAAANAIRRRVRLRETPLADDHAELPDAQALLWLQHIEDDTAFLAESIDRYFRRHRSECVELSDANRHGESLQLAERTGQSYAMLRQRWSRCIERVLDAVRRGLLRAEGLHERLRGRS